MIERVTLSNFLGVPYGELKLGPRVTLLTGANGCLHGSTPIHDPVDGTTKTVAERYRLGMPFHVWALGPHHPVIAAAMPPMKLGPEQMLRVELSNGESVVTTPNHRVWDGTRWSTMADVSDRSLRASEPVHLPSSSDIDLRARARGGSRWTETAPGSPVGCPPAPRCDDGQPPPEEADAQAPGSSPACARGHTRRRSRLGGRSSSEEHTHACPPSCPRAKSHSAPSEHLAVEECPPPQPQLQQHVAKKSPSTPPPRQGKLRSRTAPELPDAGQASIELHVLAADLPPNPSAVPHEPPYGYESNHTVNVLSVKGLDAEAYYDFHVPVFNNYWAQGIWHHNSGKTTRLGALVWALWGQNLRGGALPLGSEAEVFLSGARVIKRVVSPSGERVRLDANPVWQQKTKVLPELEARFGTFASWSRSLHLNGKTVGAFSSGSSSYRWDHLIRLTGAARYDQAIDRAKVKLKLASMLCAEAKLSEKQADSAINKALFNFNKSCAVLAGDRAPMDLQRHERDLLALSDLEERLETGRSAATAQMELSDQAAQREKDAALAVESTNHRVATLLQTAARCDACGGSVPNPELGAAELAASAAVAALTLARREGYKERDKLYAIRERIQQRERELSQVKARLELDDRAHERFLRSEEELWDKTMEYVMAGLELKQYQEKLILAGFEEQEQQRVVDTLVESRRVYLQSFLAEMNRKVNEYLRMIGARAMVQLVPVGDNGLDLVTEGTGATSYSQCSGGEQRRIDLSMALAMSEVASRIGNLTRETPLVVDEAFDTLDEAGMEALLSLACRISETRQVLLVSHVLPDLPLGPDIVHTRLGP